MATIIGIAAEIIFRNHQIMRFRDLNTGAPTAIVLTAFIFSSVHGYEGKAGVMTVGVMGIAFALVYLWRLSLFAPMIMHCLVDFMSSLWCRGLG